MFLNQQQRGHARRLSRSIWVESGFDVAVATAKTKVRVAEERKEKLPVYGNPLMALMVAYYIVCLCVLAYKIWQEFKVKEPPEQEADYEPFKLKRG